MEEKRREIWTQRTGEINLIFYITFQGQGAGKFEGFPGNLL
jgi:hypothetical protein